MICEIGALGSWPQMLVIFAAGAAVGWLRPGLEAVREWRHLNGVLRSAERLGRRARRRSRRRDRFDDRNHHHLQR